MRKHQLLEEQVALLRLLLRKMTEVSEVLEENRLQEVPEILPYPEYADVAWVMRTLDISRATYYKRVRRILLQPLMRIGNRDYFSKEEVYALLRRKREDGFAYKHMGEPLEGVARPEDYKQVA